MPRAEARKDPSTGTFRVYLLDDNGEPIRTPLGDKGDYTDAATVGGIKKATGDSPTLDDLEMDGGGFERWRPAEQLAALLNQEIMQAKEAMSGKVQRKDGSGGASSTSKSTGGSDK